MTECIDEWIDELSKTLIYNIIFIKIKYQSILLASCGIWFEIIPSRLKTAGE